MLKLAHGIAVAAGCLSLLASAHADEIRTYAVKAKFDDIRLELDNAILARGLSVHSTGNIAAMLDRTGADVGSTKAIYVAAEFVTFCSAKYSRMAMEADPSNMTLCPFGMSVYQTVARPDEVTVAYRRITGGTGANAEAYAAVNTLLDGIAKDCVK
jgi:uncharacterized protein (DUF302 family)